MSSGTTAGERAGLLARTTALRPPGATGRVALPAEEAAATVTPRPPGQTSVLVVAEETAGPVAVADPQPLRTQRRREPTPEEPAEARTPGTREGPGAVGRQPPLAEPPLAVVELGIWETALLVSALPRATEPQAEPEEMVAEAEAELEEYLLPAGQADQGAF